MQGAWSGYVEEHLIPRLNGFELLMASYTMAHLKLDMLLTETGYKPQKDRRFNIFLTNSLEEYHPDTGTLFASWLSNEANEANHVKRDTPVMVVLGNPPYSVSSSNKGEWIQNLLKDYKKDLHEKKLNLDDDYIKFIRYGQYFIEKNGEGILAYISNNSFIDGITHRQMRKELLEGFDKIYILDLHGNSNKREACADGSKDENIFDIQQGVSINIFIKTTGSKKPSNIYHSDVYGLRNIKYKFLFDNTINSITWKKLKHRKPYYFFVPSKFNKDDRYFSGFSIYNLFPNTNNGIETAKDKTIICFDKIDLLDIEKNFIKLDIDNLKLKYNLNTDKINQVKNDISRNKYLLTKILYRPFDIRWTIYSDISQGIMWRPRHNTMKHFINQKNIGLCFMRQFSSRAFSFCLVSDKIIDNRTFYSNRGKANISPLYIYSEDDLILEEKERTLNLNMEIVNKIAYKLGLTFTSEKDTSTSLSARNTFAPIDILDYIYAVLHSPTYREKYKEFLKIDFPRVPYPKDPATFWKLVKLGGKLRQIHLLESPKVNKFITKYPIDGDNVITRRLNKNDWEITDTKKQLGRIWINDEQYFEDIPLVAWEFYIGGYQPAQKWLKDRRGRKLSFEDILHYQKIIVALTETDRIMQEIDKIDIE